jgi:hypothetical protein
MSRKSKVLGRGLLIAVLTLLVACGGGEAKPAAIIAFQFDEGISESDRSLVQDVIEGARAFYVQETRRDLKRDIIVNVTTESGFNYLGISFGRNAYLFTGSPGWPQGADEFSVAIKSEVIAHELFHNFQSDLYTTDHTLPSYAPDWIFEGAAKVAAAKYVASVGEISYADWAAAYKGYLAGLNMPRLGRDDVNTPDQYVQAFVAVDMLTANVGLRGIADFYADTAYMDWEDAFLKHFGQQPEAFIERFEAVY